MKILPLLILLSSCVSDLPRKQANPCSVMDLCAPDCEPEIVSACTAFIAQCEADPECDMDDWTDPIGF